MHNEIPLQTDASNSSDPPKLANFTGQSEVTTTASQDTSSALSQSDKSGEGNIDIASSVNLENPQPLDSRAFPNQPKKGNNQLPATIANLAYLLMRYGIYVRYNIIRKKLYTILPQSSGTPDNTENVALATIISLANLNDIPVGQIPSFVEVIGDKHQFNPVEKWINSKPWDGIDRLDTFYATLVQHADFPEELKRALMYRWMLSAVAAALKPSGFKARGVLTLQGPQSIGKTSWISALIDYLFLREEVLKLDHHLDAGNKDSLLTAIAHWIVEIGELDSSFKKDIARLKGFLTADRDKVRRPYGRADSEYPRRTVFCATVNEHDFLVDSTGNSRWWTIPVTSINYQHGIDMQQLFAQLAVDFTNDVQWWLTREEEQLLELHNKEHRNVSAIRERVLEALDLSRIHDINLPAMTPTQLLQKLEIKSPTNAQSKECAGVLREFVGESKKIQGYNKWRIPFRKHNVVSIGNIHAFNPDDF